MSAWRKGVRIAAIIFGVYAILLGFFVLGCFVYFKIF
jgi:hypothetical protein